MPRKARIVVPGVPHHVTQRGTDRQTVFRAQRDRQVYLDLLAEQSRLAGVRVLAYCWWTEIRGQKFGDTEIRGHRNSGTGNVITENPTEIRGQERNSNEIRGQAT
jgi:hypothetical protein